MQRGRFISLEGLDGAGKSTHLAWLTAHLHAQGIDHLVSREPGGTPLGEKLRALLLSEEMDLETEALLMFAARREHLAGLIEPALARGQWVLCDRFTDATYAYQVGGRGLALDKFTALEQWVQGRPAGLLQPDLTLLFDVPLAVSRARLANGRELDRFEREQDAFFERVRSAYHARAAASQGRLRIIDADRPLAAIQAELAAILAELESA
ncbi:dTMP kinase [Chitinimonas taiwanensis]|jgi:dTMP kinase|uniref:Thymidylate kinase n=1 Tax=Chitinimonas taiwanensis DSM 18899 TaxID=1121279 RepID=A0A1K2HQW4_9NEIS|nr:dTMP kinase [Chitinimonas taiwanensis]SFZ78945.1 dTMP kinase [Chitinimonas taiwanensis DSM 18899]